jgi:hypothetical protein
MNRLRQAFVIFPLAACVALPAAAEEAERKMEVKTVRAESSGACACPKEGLWKAQNLEGWMNCTGPVNMKQKLKPVKDEGTIWVLDEKCSSIFSEASRKKDEDILMVRKQDSCEFTGTVSGDANGVQMVIDVNWPNAGEKFIEGDMHSKPSFQGMTCEYYRPYEISFGDSVPADEYDDRKAKMLKKLEKLREGN